MRTSERTDRILVSRQDPHTRGYQQIGELYRQGDEFVFQYSTTTELRLPGLSQGGTHRSDELFPVFAERVMHPDRPDRPHTLEQLGLPGDAKPFEILAVSGGRRTGDTYELTPLPNIGEVRLPFLVHGIRHLTLEEQGKVDMLTLGQVLQLVDEPTNKVNDRACLVTDDGTRLGYVPDPLLEYVHSIRRHAHELRVERVNPPDAGLHMRLLVVLSGFYPGPTG